MLCKDGLLCKVQFFIPMIEYIEAHSRAVDVVSGIVEPFLVLCVCEITASKESPGYGLLQQEIKQRQNVEVETKASTMPAKVMVWNLGALTVILAVTALLGRDRSYVMWVSAGILLVFMGVIMLTLRKVKS
jgi:hypothetical protein